MAGHETESEAPRAVQKWRDRVEILSSARQPSLVRLAFDLAYLGRDLVSGTFLGNGP